MDPLNAVPFSSLCILLNNLQGINGKKAKERKWKLLDRFHTSVIQAHGGNNW